MGILLYELLTGMTPLQMAQGAHASFHSMLERIRVEDPTPPSKVANSKVRLDPEFDWIVLKALARERRDRFETVNGMTRDLERYLNGAPVEAAPLSNAYVLREFVRKHRLGLAVSSLVALILATALVVSSWMTARARSAEHAAVEQRNRADQAAAASTAVNNFLRNDLLAQASASRQRSLSGRPDPDMTVRTALDRAATNIEGKFDRQPQVEAAIRDTIGRTYMDLGIYPQAQIQLERALTLYRSSLGVENPETARTMSRLGRTVWLQGDNSRAEALIGQALAIEKRFLGVEDTDTLYSMNNLANVYRAQGKDGQGEALYRQTLEIRRRVLGTEHPDTLTSMNNLANVYWSQGYYVQAEILYAQALGIQRRVLGAEHPDALLSASNLADTYSREGKFFEAEPLFDQTREASSRVFGPQHPRTLSLLSDQAFTYEQQGKFELASRTALLVFEGRRRSLGSDNMETMQSAMDLALVSLSQGNYAQTEQLSRTALEFLKARHPTAWQRYYAESLLGESLARRKRYSEADPWLREGYAGMLQQQSRLGWMGVPNVYHLAQAHEWIVDLDRGRCSHGMVAESALPMRAAQSLPTAR